MGSIQADEIRVKCRVKAAVIDACSNLSQTQAKAPRELLGSLLAYDDGCALGPAAAVQGALALAERKDTQAVPELTQALTLMRDCRLPERELYFCPLKISLIPLRSQAWTRFWLRIAVDSQC